MSLLQSMVEIKFNLFAVISFFLFVLNLAIAKIAFDRRKQRGALYLSIWMLVISFWLLMATFQYSSYDLKWNIFWAKMLYWGVVQIPVWFVFFAWSFTGHVNYITRRNVLIHSIVPIIALVFVWTNDYHNLIWSDYHWIEEYKAWNYTLGPGLYVLVVGYIYLNLVYGSYFLLKMIIQNFREMGIQALFILIGLLIPWIVNALYMANFTGIGLDPTPMALTISGWLFVFAMFRLNLLNVVKVARDEVIEAMADGVLIIDYRNVVLDFNPALINLLGKTTAIFVGNDVGTALDSYPELVERLQGGSTPVVTVLYTEYGNRKHEVTVSPLYGRRILQSGRSYARMIILRDITMTAKAKELLAEKNRKLEEQLAQNETLRQQLQHAVIHDPLTGLYNRRFFEELVTKELSNARRHNLDLTVIIIDIDNFKKFNDSYGHLAGDEALRVFGKFLFETARQEDIVCRYGGEEFVAVFTGAHPELISKRAQNLLSEVRKIPVIYENNEYHFTISVGVGSYPMDGVHADAIFKAADDRLYKAKENGRDRIWSYLDEENPE